MSWRKHLKARLSTKLWDYPAIAELHAVEALGATVPSTEHASNRRGYDVSWKNLKVEVKSKAPNRHRIHNVYVIVDDVKLEVADLFWFYLFSNDPDGLEVYELGREQVAVKRGIRSRANAIYMNDVIADGVKIWDGGKPCREDHNASDA